MAALVGEGHQLVERCAGEIDLVTLVICRARIVIDRKLDSYALTGEHERWTEAETVRRFAPPQ